LYAQDPVGQGCHVKNKTVRTLLFLFVGFGLFGGFQNCSKVAVSDMKNDSASAAGSPDGTQSTNGNNGDGNTTNQQNCQTQLIDSLKTVKILFLMDTSGSNTGTDGTDIGKKWRTQVLQNVISRYQSKSNFYYGLATFQNSSATPQITVDSKAVFSNQMDIVNQGIDRFEATPDDGRTPYQPTLMLAKDLIAQDLAKNPSSETSYVVVMISDGRATDYPNGPDSIIPDAQAVMAVAPKQITLNSVYYYAAAAIATDTPYLQNIAKVGQGNFITANSNESLQIDDVIKVPQTVCK